MGIKTKTYRLIVGGLCFLLALAGTAHGARAVESSALEPYGRISTHVSGDQAYQFVKRLTMEDMGGRQAGTEGSEKAADYIAEQFKSFGLKPFRGGSYFQSLPVTYFNLIQPLSFQFRAKNQWIVPKYREDYQVFIYSGEGKVSSQCVFIGYGICAPALQYDEYNGISVAGKVALLLLDLPEFFIDKKEEYTIYQRINTAYTRGASGVVILLKEGVSPPFRSDMKMAIGYDASLPVLLAHQGISSSLLKAGNQNLDNLVQSIESTRKPSSRALDLDLKIEVNFELEPRTSKNVIGYIPSVDPTNRESILITSHYDGLGIDNILGTIYHGANDNASSTGCMMEVAGNLSEHECLPNVNLVFIAFTGEEEGLLGSYQYVSDPLFPLGKIKAVLNSEEIGTFDGENLIGTSKTIYPELSKLIANSAKYLKIKVTFLPDLLYPGSDHYPFHERGIPSVCFARLPLPYGYPEYHKLSDTIDIISPKSLEVFCQIITMVTLSYSESTFFDFSGFPVESKGGHPYVLARASCFVPSDSTLNVTVNHQLMSLPSTEEGLKELALFIPLSGGANEVLVEVKFKTRVWITKRIVILCSPILPLRADFNQDLRVDLADLQLLGRKLDSPAALYHPDSLYDLNQDQIINETDYQLFSEYFGYQ